MERSLNFDVCMCVCVLEVECKSDEADAIVEAVKVMAGAGAGAGGTGVGMAYDDTVLDADMAARTDAAVAVATGGASALVSEVGESEKKGDVFLPLGDRMGCSLVNCWAAERAE